MSAQRGGRSASRVILLTGASGGIGRATAARLAQAGHLVFAAARRASALEELAATHPGIRPVPLDVTDPAAIDHARHQVMAATGGYGLDVLVDAAGILVLGPVEAVSDQQTRAQLEVNLFGTRAVTRAFLPPMRQRRGRRIINVSSILGRFALPGSGVYSASKFALEAAPDALRIELAPFGVQVVLVQPGVIAPTHAHAIGPGCATASTPGCWPCCRPGRRIGSRRGSPAGCPRTRRRHPAPTAPPPPSRRDPAATRRAPTPRGQASEPVRRPRNERRRAGEG
jgi:NAD(P)-dependent dehydrogenase (short-subunit alcohol dehydrogenase family)